MKAKIYIIIALFLLLNQEKVFAQTDGTLDTSFDIGIGFSGGGINAMALHYNPNNLGEIITVGYFLSYNGQPRRHIARLHLDGSIDTSFNQGSGFDNEAYAVAVQPNGRILVGGYFSSYNGQSVSRLVRLNQTGTLDTSFNTGTGFVGIGTGTITTIALQPDGKILVGGWFISYNGHLCNNILRLNPNGSIDTSFNSGTGFSSTVRTICLQPDGKILVGGWFTTYNGQPRNGIARLNPDGSLDNTFNIGVGFNSDVMSIVTIPSGMIVGGYFTNYNGQIQNRIARLYTNGSLDNFLFNIGTGFNNIVNTIALQPNGKILVGGGFISYNGHSISKIARLNSDGSFDPSFIPGGGFNSNANLRSIVIQQDGKILVGGYFTDYNGQAQNGILRLHNSFLSTEEQNLKKLKIYPNPVKDILYFGEQINKVTLTDPSGKILSKQSNINQIDISTFPSGIYLILFEQENGKKEIKKIIKN